MVTQEEYLKAKSTVEEYEQGLCISHLDLKRFIDQLPDSRCVLDLQSPFMSFYAPIGNYTPELHLNERHQEPLVTKFAKITFQARPICGDWVIVRL